jgi:DNA-binding NarL/FixJ family response regulator
MSVALLPGGAKQGGAAAHVCPQCHRALALTAEYWFPVRDKPGYFYTGICRACDYRVRSARRQRARELRAKGVKVVEPKARPTTGHREPVVIGKRQPGQRLEDVLPPRLAQIARLVACGTERKAIAREMGLSQHTVKNHIDRLYRALGVNCLGELCARLYMEGWLGQQD